MRYSQENFRAQGVTVLHPESTYIAEDVNLAAIGPGTHLYPGCRLSGATLSIGPNCRLGEEGPVTLENSQLGAGVRIKGGYVSGAVCWDGVEIGSAAHIRPGTLLEEGSGCAHAVGLKQTIFFPWVIAGSLINFCDALMAGGTSRKRHSEIGSSFIHFNYTPYGDKATASLIGDVPRGVMLDQAPIFLGGQGGLVGPVHLEYGTVMAAGSINRMDVNEANALVVPEGLEPGAQPFDPSTRRDVTRRFQSNIHFIGQLIALKAWYEYARPLIITSPYGQACLDGGLRLLSDALTERRNRVSALVEMVHLDRSLVEGWKAHEAHIDAMDSATLAPAERSVLLNALAQSKAPDQYTEAVQLLPLDARRAGTAWLQAIVNNVTTR